MPLEDCIVPVARYKEITKCRVCGSKNIMHVLSLGHQTLTGVFPQDAGVKVSSGPLDLVWCPDCGLLQMKQSYDALEMYGENYGYRSGLNKSMVEHLTNKVGMLERMVKFKPTDIVLDIGSNDGTLLKAYEFPCQRVGIDPTIIKFGKYYDKDIIQIPEFFSEFIFREYFRDGQAKIITSIAMFYDLENPNQFVKEIRNILAYDGLWHLEMAYMPSMLRLKAYDAVCHEHLEFYSFRVIKHLLESNGMKVIDVEMNATNGGSFAVTACKASAPYIPNTPIINWMLGQEDRMQLNTPNPYRVFETQVYNHREDLRRLITSLNEDGKVVFGYGASTKGNVLIQFCGFTEKDIPYIADVNPDKHGCVTPGSHIPIISEKDAADLKPDYYLVFPWHFRYGILEREKEYLKNGGKFIFPMPEIEIV